MKDILKEITSVSEIIDFIDEEEFKKLAEMPSTPPEAALYQLGFGMWFRGQSEHEQLVPSVFRRHHQEDDYIDETSATYHFTLQAPASRDRCKNSFDWLCLMRHFELPTRLLDWSENMLVALHFAAQKPDCKDGHFFILNAPKLNRITRTLPPALAERLRYRGAHRGIGVPWGIETALRAEMSRTRTFEDFMDQIASLDHSYIEDGITFGQIKEFLQTNGADMMPTLATPLAAYPNRLDTRMILQQSVFTIHGGKTLPDRPQSGDVTLLPKPVGLTEVARRPDQEEFLLHLKVNKDSKEDIRERLRFMGIYEASLFPELDKLSSFIRSQWTPKKRPLVR